MPGNPSDSACVADSSADVTIASRMISVASLGSARVAFSSMTRASSAWCR